jgi:Flp pilus assembly protein TadG
MTSASRSSGMVTAETAVLAPVVASCLALGVWIVSLGHLQVQLVDAARDAARLVARGESVDEAVGHVRSSAPRGTTFTVRRAGGFVTVRVARQSPAPLPGLTWPVRAEASCIDES